MKNVGILTYDFSSNYGAVLQAWALIEKCKSFNCRAKVIRWAPFYWFNNEENDSMSVFRQKYLHRTPYMILLKQN